MNPTKKNKQIFVGIAFLLLILLLSLGIWGIVEYFGGMEQCVSYLTQIAQQNPFVAFFLFIGIQILQVLVSVIPGEPVEVLAGVLYGTFGGTLVCLLGITLGNLIIFYLVRKFGMKLIKKLTGKENTEEFQLLNKFSNLDYVIFVLFLIPGTPKDMLIYAAALTPISIWKFIILTNIARIPSIASSTYAGTHIGSGNYLASILVFAVIALLGVGGIYLQPKIMNMLQNRNKKKK